MINGLLTPKVTILVSVNFYFRAFAGKYSTGYVWMDVQKGYFSFSAFRAVEHFAHHHNITNHWPTL